MENSITYVLQNIQDKQIIAIIGYNKGYEHFLQQTICTAIMEHYDSDNAEMVNHQETSIGEKIYLVSIETDGECINEQFELVPTAYYEAQ